MRVCRKQFRAAMAFQLGSASCTLNACPKVSPIKDSQSQRSVEPACLDRWAGAGGRGSRAGYFLPSPPREVIEGGGDSHSFMSNSHCIFFFFFTPLCPNSWASSLWGIQVGEQHPKAWWPRHGGHSRGLLSFPLALF